MRRDAAEFFQASETPDMAEQLDTDQDRIHQLAHPCPLTPEAVSRILFWHQAGLVAARQEERGEALRMIAAALWTKGDANIRLAALAFVAGLTCFEGKSMSAVAKSLKCTRAAISKEANKWTEKLQLKSCAMKNHPHSPA